MFLLLSRNNTEILNKFSITENWKTLSETNKNDELFKASIFPLPLTFTEVMHIDYSCINLRPWNFHEFLGKCFLIELARALLGLESKYILELFIFLENINNQFEAEKLHEIAATYCEIFTSKPLLLAEAKNILKAFSVYPSSQKMSNFIGTDLMFWQLSIPT